MHRGMPTLSFSFQSPSRSYHLSKSPTIVLFPLPDGPTMAVVLPAGILRFTPARAFTSGRVGYVKLTLVRTMSPFAEISSSGGFLPEVEGMGRSMVVKRVVAAREERRMAVMGGARVVRAIVVIITVMRTLVVLEVGKRKRV